MQALDPAAAMRLSSDGESWGTGEDAIDYVGHAWDSARPADEGAI